ncbi:MAG: hypothetical protein QOF60_2361, partial [Actinomycetota bacterium]|nr:hypothetical protein [Actinomycetota bacterium]
EGCIGVAGQGKWDEESDREYADRGRYLEQTMTHGASWGMTVVR